MKTGNGGAPLIALLNTSTQFAMADLFTFTLRGGTVIRYTSADKRLLWNGNWFELGPIIKRDRTKTRVGITVDTMDITMSAPSTVQVNGVPLMAFIAAGGLDGARVRLERAFMSDWATAVVGTVLVFPGRVNDATASRFESKVTVASDLEILDTRVPRNVYQPGCVNSLYDSSCGLSKAALTVSNAVTASPAPTKFAFDSTLAQATGFFDLGVVTFTDGPNAGISRTVKSFVSGGLITPIAPFPFTPVVGNAFTVYPGCNKSVARCAELSNSARFRGFPFIPVAETVM